MRFTRRGPRFFEIFDESRAQTGDRICYMYEYCVVDWEAWTRGGDTGKYDKR